MKQKIELLAPAGDFACMNAAINAGADAVFFGIKGFNMRVRAKNFELSDLPKIKEICDGKNVKKYLTLNIIVYDNELENVEKVIKEAKDYVDAVICSDIAVMQICKKLGVKFHISTQCSVSNINSAKGYIDMGASRIVLARELSLKQVEEIAKEIPVEVFIHGAMCSSISGRCFTSQFLTNKSANRGECSQHCRRAYTVKDRDGNELEVENNYIFSAKDLCTLGIIEELKKSGAVSFKIEGRNRDPVYVDVVVRVYREAIDNKLSPSRVEELMKEMEGIFNKGFSSGFYMGKALSEGFSKMENSSAVKTKEFLGKITHYYPKVRVGLLKLNSGRLQIGDDIVVIGDTTGVLRVTVGSLEVEGNKVEGVVKGDDVGIRLERVREGDEVYKINNR